MAISGPRYLVLEAALVAEERWTTDLAPKPNCYLSAELAAARADELTAQALRQGAVRNFRIHRTDGGSAPTAAAVPEQSAA